MTDTPLVSIIMNCYNSQDYLREAIQSIIDQSYTHWELIFWDNQSTDESAKITRSFQDPRIKYFYAPEHTQLGEARNLALPNATGKYIAFLDCDDIWLSSKLAQQVELMQTHPGYMMCYGGVIYINATGDPTGEMKPRASSGYIFDKLLVHYEINMQSVILRNTGNISFDPSLQFSPDFDRFMHIASESDVGVIQEPLVKYRRLEGSLTAKKIDRWWIEYKQTLDAIFSAKPELATRCPQESKLAYAKVAYYKARYNISIGNRIEARKVLKPFYTVSFPYFVLYCLLFLPVTVWNIVHKIKQVV